MDGSARIDVRRKGGPWSDAAWLALLPGPTPGGGAAWAAAAPDPARAARDADPLTPERVAHALADAGLPALGRFMALRMRAVARSSLWMVPLWLASNTLPLPMLAVPFAAASYSSRALATFLVAVTWCTAAWFVTNALSARTASGYRDPGFEQFVRYVQLSTSSSHADSLLEHSDRDPRCPCPAPACLGRLRTSFTRALAARTVYSFASLWTSYAFVFFYTQLVTLGGYTWTQAWSFVFAVLSLVIRTVWYTAGALFLPFNELNAASVDLSSRLEARAFDLSLGQLLDSAAAAAASLSDSQTEADPDPAASLPPITAEPYWTVHDALAPRMRTRFANFEPANRVVLAGMAIELVSGFVYVVGSSCLPAWVLLAFCTWASFALSDLVTVALANARAGAVADLHRSAAAELHRLVLSLPAAERSAPLRRQLLDREAALASVAGEAEHMRARFAGVVVDTGVVRTVLATGLTVGVALFGILRGSVAVTLESVCNTA
ncbi:hypothetical protein DFJ74DRAFT_708924 [Hyaloraphidium curvatum]|nr:hypothetical protein DFJ74DRAFT_708924 [Hyaloraphidium curvatum]